MSEAAPMPADLQRAAAPTLEQIRKDRKKAPARLRPLLDYLERHLFDPDLDASQLKRACGVRDNSASTWFHQALSLPPYAYIEDCRMEVACRLLGDTEFKVWQIAQLLGSSFGLSRKVPCARVFAAGLQRPVAAGPFRDLAESVERRAVRIGGRRALVPSCRALSRELSAAVGRGALGSHNALPIPVRDVEGRGWRLFRGAFRMNDGYDGARAGPAESVSGCRGRGRPGRPFSQGGVATMEFPRMKPDFDPMRILGEGSTALVEESEKSPEAIALEIGISVRHLRKVMNGEANLSARVLFDLAESLGCRISEIYARGEALVLGDTSDPEWEEILSGLQELVRRTRAKTRLERERAEGRPGTEVPS